MRQRQFRVQTEPRHPGVLLSLFIYCASNTKDRWIIYRHWYGPVVTSVKYCLLMTILLIDLTEHECWFDSSSGRCVALGIGAVWWADEASPLNSIPLLLSLLDYPCGRSAVCCHESSLRFNPTDRVWIIYLSLHSFFYIIYFLFMWWWRYFGTSVLGTMCKSWGFSVSNSPDNMIIAIIDDHG